METVLRELVQREGFETVFNALREIVTKEYERANRDYQFFLNVTKAVPAAATPATVTVQKESEATAENTIETPVPEAVQNDSEAFATPTKTVAIKSNVPSAPKKIIRKRS